MTKGGTMRGFSLALIGVGLIATGILAALATIHQGQPAQALEAERIQQWLAQNNAPSKGAVAQTGEVNPVQASKKELFQNEEDPSYGPEHARVTLVEFFDYRCPYCKQMAKGVDDLMASDPDLRVVFKEFPILTPDSVTASKAALAAHRQGKYLPFHRLLMEHRGVFDQETLDTLAAQAELDLDRLRKDMDDPEILEALRANHRLAEKLSIDGTPAFVLGDQIVPGAVPIEELREKIRSLALHGGG